MNVQNTVPLYREFSSKFLDHVSDSQPVGFKIVTGERVPEALAHVLPIRIRRPLREG